MARGQAEERTRKPRSLNEILRYAVLAGLMLVFAVAAIAALHRTEQYLVSNALFTLKGPAGDGRESPDIRLHGIVHAPRRQVMDAFERDYGRSVYLVQMEERRRHLLAIDWVRDASIRRRWPNRLDVYITERRPVAFVPLPTSAGARLALIDEEGIILEPPAEARYRLPIITGVRPEQSPNSRRSAVERMLRLLAEVGEMAGRISEVDVAEPDNLKVVEQVDDRVITLLLGDRSFRQRLSKFHNYYPQIRGQLGPAATLDLRVDKRIISVKGVRDAR